MANRLAGESSPYLQQHAENPVDWYPWGDEALSEARASDKPIFLSVGYGSCHWCHVMARESFEDEGIAALLNSDFVSIKVDREERPDLDGIYMRAVQALTGRGGWPMSVWLTPDRKPFYGGTYFPKERFTGILRALVRAWEGRREEVLKSATDITARMQRRLEAAGATASPPPDATKRGVRSLARRFDEAHAGFGSRPKFPSETELLFLLNSHEVLNNIPVFENL